MSDDKIPRRIRIDQFTPAERAIYDAIRAVESLPPDVRLTAAVVLLSQAREQVADFVDGVEAEARPDDTCTALHELARAREALAEIHCLADLAYQRTLQASEDQ